MINIHYAIQTCDIASYQGQKRFCSDSKSEITQKCITSFFISAENLKNKFPDLNQVVKIFDDSSTEETKNYLILLKDKFNSDKISIEIEFLEKQGIAKSIENCYNWLRDSGTHFVYQIQDDYLFEKNSLSDTAQMFADLKEELQVEPIITPYNDPYLWGAVYRNKPTPRTIFCGRTQYWIQAYDLTCSFFTSKYQFTQHWDLYEKFFDYVKKCNPKLESETLNLILTTRGVLGIAPFRSTALHMQSTFEKDPYIDWKSLWDSVPIFK